MYVRLVYVTGDPRRIDDAITAVTKQAPELLREQPGYRGVAVLADRELGKLIIGSYWDDAQAAQRSDEALRERRAQSLTPFAASMSVELYEIAVAHQARQPGAGAATRVLRMEFDPAAADERIAAARGTLDKLDGTPGFCRAAYFVDRQRGRAVVALTYADRDTLAASRSSGAALRAEVNHQTQHSAATRSLEELDVVLFEAPTS